MGVAIILTIVSTDIVLHYLQMASIAIAAATNNLYNSVHDSQSMVKYTKKSLYSIFKVTKYKHNPK